MGVGRVPVALHAGGSGSELVGARTPWVSALGSVFGARVAERGFRGLCCLEGKGVRFIYGKGVRFIYWASPTLLP